MKKTTRLRRLLEAPEILFRVSIATAIQAQLAEAAGFEAVGISGSNFASHVLGLPDAGLATLTEVVDNVRHVVNAVHIPVIADCEQGFGNAINMRRATAQFVQAGAAGLFFEDQTFPPRCGFVSGKQVLDLDEAAGKVRAAVDAKNEIDPDFVIIARTDCRTVEGGSVAKVIERCHAFKAAGADVIYVEALQSRDEVAEVRRNFDGMLTGTVSAIKPLPTLEELQDLGFCMAIGNHFYKAGVVAMWDMLVRMRNEGLEPWNEFLRETKDHPLGGYGSFDLTGYPEIAAWERDYLPASQRPDYEDPNALYDPAVGHHPAVRRKRPAWLDET